MTRVGVYIDYENMRESAVRAFAAPKTLELNPIQVAGACVRPHETLVAVSVYQGLAPYEWGAGAARKKQSRRLQRWARDAPSSVAFAPRGRRVRPTAEGGWCEQGVDVMLVVDAYTGVRDGDVERVIVASHDSDLQSLVLGVAEDFGVSAVATASWWAKNHRYRIAPVRIGSDEVNNRSLGADAFARSREP